MHFKKEKISVFLESKVRERNDEYLYAVSASLMDGIKSEECVTRVALSLHYAFALIV